MKIRLGLTLVCAITITSLNSSVFGQLLYSENFDTDNSSNWMLNASTATDSFADFFYDYSLVGVPSAPGAGGSTRGMKIQANLFTGVFGGASVSPIGQSFTGDYVLSWDMWSNYSGGDASQTTHGINNSISGSTNLSYGGVGSSGTFSNSAGMADGVFFTYTGDGQSGSDYRAYSQDRDISYQVPGTDPADDAATYFAGSRNNIADLYRLNINPEPDPVGAPGVGGVTAPAAQVSIAANYSPPVDQGGFVPAGAAGFAWRHNEISVVNNVYTWTVDGTTLITVDGNSFTTPPAGNNILFGHADINNGSAPAENNAFELVFTLVDNIEVNVFNASIENADFDSDGDVDGKDFLTWQRNVGLMGSATPMDGDANGDLNVDGDDLIVWQDQYGGAPPLSANVAAVPEPATWASLAVAALLGFVLITPRRSLATSRV